MTPEDRELNPALLLKENLTLYRLAKAEYANLSGIGAALFPGRWNGLGEDAIYTSTEKAATVLERLVHTPKSVIPTNLAMMEITLHGDWALSSNSMIDRQDGSIMRVYSKLESAPKRNLSEAFAVAVPSVIVPVWNIVLFPRYAGFWNHITLKSVEPFEFDPRLFPDTVLAK